MRCLNKEKKICIPSISFIIFCWSESECKLKKSWYNNCVNTIQNKKIF